MDRLGTVFVDPDPGHSPGVITILDTVHGSHLYGLAHPGSDCDTYKVVVGDDKSYARQRSCAGDDRLGIHLSRFLQQVDKGVPQALEALFSPVAELDPDWAPFLRSLRPGIISARMTYRRTITNFAYLDGGRTGAAKLRAQTTERAKLRRHALRLSLNLAELVATSSFDPRLSRAEAEWVIATAEADEQTFTETLGTLLGEAQLGRRS